jgi:MSHA biogenesis protein MshQ
MANTFAAHGITPGCSAGALVAPPQGEISETISATGPVTAVVPYWARSARVQCWGQGGDGGGVQFSADFSGGGGGGAYAEDTIAVEGSAPIVFAKNVGAATAGCYCEYPPGNVVVLAARGVKGQTGPTPGAAGGAGGAVVDCVGSIKYAGGVGGAGGSARSGGGGGSAGPSVAGNAGGAGDAGGVGATAVTGGGAGGNGAAAGAGGVGKTPGGGGGGSGVGAAGSSGWYGQVIVTWRSAEV